MASTNKPSNAGQAVLFSGVVLNYEFLVTGYIPALKFLPIGLHLDLQSKKIGTNKEEPELY